VPQLVVAAFGVSTSNASFMLIPLVSAVAVGSPIVGKLLDRLGSRTVLLGGSTTLTLGLACLGLLGSTDITFFFLAMILMGLGIAALVGAPLRYIVLAEAEPSERATAQGSINIFLGIGQLLGGAFIGAIAGSVGGGAAGYAAAYTAGAAIAALLVLASLGLKNRQTEQAAVQAQAT
jgi:MFS family permease